MKVQKILYTVCVIALVMPMMANAEIYKWKGKNGVTRYSDTPPPARVKVEVIDKTGTDQRVRPAATEGASPVRLNGKPAMENGKAKPQRFKEPEFDKEMGEEASAENLRTKNAEVEKSNKLERETQAKRDIGNCKAARANYQAYAQGGRIYTTNENGERKYLGDADLAAGKAKTQGEINKYCK